jgi:phenylpyruvate tautomerase PptA (4-oxalocrotonate tautomerase family)
MPMLEVLYVKEEPFQLEQKRAFTRAAVAIIQEVLKVRAEQVRLVFEYIAPENGHIALLKEDDEASKHL